MQAYSGAPISDARIYPIFHMSTPFTFDSDENTSPSDGGYSVTNASLSLLSKRILSEPLMSQRLIGSGCVTLLNDVPLAPPLDRVDLSNWGATLPSAIAAMLPSCDQQIAKEQRERRHRQQQILLAQNRFPDLASFNSAAFLLCADHKPPEYGLPQQLYASPLNAKLAEWGAFESLVDSLLSAVSPNAAPAWLKGGQSLRQALTTIIFETFKNTHDHARTEVDGSTVSCSLRGLYARFYSVEEAVASASSHVPNQAELYARSFIPAPPRPGVRPRNIEPISGFVELSILDSGPGMAARWRRGGIHDVSARVQGDAVLACFAKGQSTTGTTGRGYGLWKVLLNLAQLKGFISVRTNGIHVFRQFGYTAGYGRSLGIRQDFGESARPAEHFYDWKRGFVTEPSPYPTVRGTVVSFLLPMGVAQ